MESKTKRYLMKIVVAAVALMMVFCVGLVAACGGKKDPKDDDVPAAQTQTYTVYFFRNCSDNVDEPEQKVTEGGYATFENPYRYGYEVEGWYLDPECTQKFDFGTPITGDLELYANWVDAVNRYEVSFDLNGGSGSVAAQTVKEGECADEPAAPARSGYVFMGWYLDAAGNTAYSFSNAVTSDMTLYAKWAVARTVTLDYNYTGSTASTVEVADGEALKTDAPTRSGYVFGGWYEDADCTEPYRYTAITADTTLYAEWVSESAAEYTYTFNFNYDGAGAATRVTVRAGAIPEIPDIPEREGTSFGGWYEDAECTIPFDVYSRAASDHTLYAKWVTLGITFIYNYDGAPSSVFVAYEEGQTTAPIADPARPGYTFAGWSTAANRDPDFTFGEVITDAIELYAQWSMVYVFEAEDTDLDGIYGFGFSGGANGMGLVTIDDGRGANASNDHYLYCLNNPGLTITFNFTSDRAATGVKFCASLSGEIKNFGICCSTSPMVDEYGYGAVDFLVNGVAVNYGEIAFLDVPSQSSDQVKAFEMYTLGYIDLVEGENVIQLVVNNDNDYMGGTMWAIAPMFDCITLETSAVLVFVPVVGNY